MPQPKTTLLARIRSGAWKIIRPIVLALDWLLGTASESGYSPHLTSQDPSVEAARHETDIRVGHTADGGPSMS
jgi:hypothetical protein